MKLHHFLEPQNTKKRSQQDFSSPLCPVWLVVAPVAYILRGAAARHQAGNCQVCAGGGSTNQGQPGVNTHQIHTATVPQVTNPHKET